MNLRTIAVFLILVSLLAAGCMSDNGQDDTGENTSEGEQNETIDDDVPVQENETPAGEETPVQDNETPVDEETPANEEAPADETTGGVTVVQPTGPSTYTVRLENFLAQPANLTINTGDSVVWINFNSPTRNFVLISDEGLWEDQTIGYRGSFVYAFNETGTYTYKIQGFEGRMKGSINVI